MRWSGRSGSSTKAPCSTSRSPTACCTTAAAIPTTTTPASLTPEDWRAIRARLPEAPDPLFERREDRRFEALYRDILAWDQQLPAGA